MPEADRTTPQTIKKKIRRKKTAAPKKSYTLPKTHHTETQTDRPRKPVAGPPSPQTTGKASRPQPIRRKRDAPPARTDRTSDAKRTPAQKKRDRQAVAENVSEARRKVIRRRGRGAGVKLATNALRFGATAGAGQSSVSSTRGRRFPGATASAEQAYNASALGKVPTKAIEGTAKAFVEAPKKTTVNTAKGLRDALTGIPGAVVKTGIETVEGTAHGDPLRGVKNAGKGYVKDVSRRYGPLTQPGGQGTKEFKERVKKEGAAGELLDASTLVTGAGAATGQALSKAAKAGKLGAKAKKVSTERPRLRVSGGESVEQTPSRNLIVAGGQAAVDKARKKKAVKRVRRADAKGTRASALDLEAVKHGEVVAGRRRSARVQRESVARTKGRTLHVMKREQAEEVGRGTNRNISRLSKAERRAFKYAVELGIRTPEAARKTLRKRQQDVTAHREAKGVDVPKVLRKTNDELPVMRWLEEHADEAFTPKLAKVADQERRRAKRTAQGDPALSGERVALRNYAKVAEHLGVTRREGESPKAFVSRVRTAARKEGLADPGYFSSQKRPTIRYSDYAAGGAAAIMDDKSYTGALYRTGREDTRPEVLSQSLARNIKRKHNWNMVAENADRHTFKWSRDKSAKELLDEMDRRGIDPNSVALWNPKRYMALARKTDDGEATAGDEPVVTGLSDAFRDSAVTVKELASRPEEFQKATGFSLIPRAVYDELHADTKPSGKVARSYEVVKGKSSRLLLGTNPAWLQFQVASNALLTGLAGVGPVDAVKAQVWWKGLSKDEKAAIEPYVGVGRFQDSVQQTKLGASANGKLVNAYRAFKQTPFFDRPRKALRGGTVKDLNPLDVLFRIDNAQNNAFRRAVLYNQAKRQAYRQMGENAGRFMERQRHLTGLLTLGPKEQIRAVVKDRRRLEESAQAVNDFLGDFSTYTAKERRVLGRSVMFYGFLRYSLRFTFWTMPTKHPVMSSIVANLGRLQTDEVRKLLGGDTLPWALGKLYFSKDGKLESVDVSRMNPTANALTNLKGPADVVGFMPPVVSAALNQVASKTIFMDRGFLVDGEDKPRRATEYTAEQRARIFADQGLLSLIAPYREWEKAATKGRPQGDDSLLGDRPTTYSDKDKQLGLERRLQADKRSTGTRLLEGALPFVPRPDRAKESAELNRTYKTLDAKRKALADLTAREASDDGYYNSAKRQSLVDEVSALEEQVNKLQAQGPPAKAKKGLLKRPLPYDKQIQQRVDENLKKYDDYDRYLEEKYGRKAARLKIQGGG